MPLNYIRLWTRKTDFGWTDATRCFKAFRNNNDCNELKCLDQSPQFSHPCKIQHNVKSRNYKPSLFNKLIGFIYRKCYTKLREITLFGYSWLWLGYAMVKRIPLFTRVSQRTLMSSDHLNFMESLFGIPFLIPSTLRKTWVSTYKQTSQI